MRTDVEIAATVLLYITVSVIYVVWRLFRAQRWHCPVFTILQKMQNNFLNWSCKLNCKSHYCYSHHSLFMLRLQNTGPPANRINIRIHQGLIGNKCQKLEMPPDIAPLCIVCLKHKVCAMLVNSYFVLILSQLSQNRYSNKINQNCKI